MWIFLLVAFSMATGHDIDASITQITLDNFQFKVGVKRPWQNSTDALPKEWFLMFYSPTCPHCQKAMPFWNQFGQMAYNSTNLTWVNVGAVNCAKYMTLCNQLKASFFPTFYYLTKDHKKLKYDGDRTMEGFDKFALEAHTGKTEQQLGIKKSDNATDTKSQSTTETKSSDKASDTGKAKLDQKQKSPPKLQRDSGRSGSDANKHEQKKHTVSVKKQQSSFQKIRNFFTQLTWFQILELVIILILSLGLAYLLMIQDKDDFKRIGVSERGGEHGILGLSQDS